MYLRNTVLSKMKLISILQRLWYANEHTNLQNLIISVYQRYLAMKSFDLEKYLRAFSPLPVPMLQWCSDFQPLISLFHPLSYPLPHFGYIACLVSHTPNTISLPSLKHLCTFLGWGKLPLGICCTYISALGTLLALLGEEKLITDSSVFLLQLKCTFITIIIFGCNYLFVYLFLHCI